MAIGKLSVCNEFAGLYIDKKGKLKEREGKEVLRMDGETLRTREQISRILNMPEIEIELYMRLGMPFFVQVSTKQEFFKLTQVKEWLRKNPKV